MTVHWGQLLRIYTMIAGVSAVSLYVFAVQFSDVLLSIGTVAVATVALVSVIVGALLAGSGTVGDGSSVVGADAGSRRDATAEDTPTD